MLGIVLALLDEAFCHLARQYWNVCNRYCHDKYVFKLNIRVQRYKLFCRYYVTAPTFFYILRQSGRFCVILRFSIWRGCSNLLRLVLLHGIVLLLLMLGVLGGSLALLQGFLHALGLLVLACCKRPERDITFIFALDFVFFTQKEPSLLCYGREVCSCSPSSTARGREAW